MTQEDRVSVTLGRHTNDFMTSFYAKTPSSFMIECGWGGREIDPATWQPVEMHDGPSLWGHERVWLPPEDREVAREMRMRAAASGLRAPVQVMEGNYKLMSGTCAWWDGVSGKVSGQMRNRVVPANAGTHNHRALSFAKSSTASKRCRGVWVLRSQGRRRSTPGNTPARSLRSIRAPSASSRAAARASPRTRLLDAIVSSVVPSPHSAAASAIDIAVGGPAKPSMRLMASQASRIEFSPFSAK